MSGTTQEMTGYRVLGLEAVKAEYLAAHCERLVQWFDADGKFVHFGTAPSSRERLWNCMSLLASGEAQHRTLAEAIILRTPIDHNHFEPFAAVELALRYRDVLAPETLAYLQRICAEHFLNSLEVRCGVPGTNNFSCMATWFLLAASQALEDGYAFDHPLASIPEVYTKYRIRSIGRNALHALAHYSEHEPVFLEFNSPNYSPISVHCMAKIIELVDDPAAKALALQIELKLWRELLSFYHPALGVSCGPFSRSYRSDILGQNTFMRYLLCYCGISKDRSLVELLNDPHPGILVAHDGDVPFTWSQVAWQVANRYHVPEDALAEVQQRQYPHELHASYAWDEFGYIDKANKRYVSVQNDVLPAGASTLTQRQQPLWSLGWRGTSSYAHSFPIHFSYALTPEPRTMQDTRHVTGAVVLFNAPDEWVPDQTGQPIEASNFNNGGPVTVEEAEGALRFNAALFPQFAPLPTNELSLNTFIPLHFADVDAVTLNGQRYAGQALEITAAEAVCRVEDRGFVYEICYRFPMPVTFRLYRWANFLRFAGCWYAGATTEFTPDFLAACHADGELRIVETPS